VSEPTHVIGVDLGGTKIRAGVADGRGDILRTLERPTPRGSTTEVLRAVREVVEELGAADVDALGLAIPGTIDLRTGRVVTAANLPFRDDDVKAPFEQSYGVPVALDNDANAATLAEWKLGAGRGARHMVMVVLGTGIGGGLILDGRLYRGAHGTSGELGHVVIGGKTLELRAAGPAADRYARELFGPESDARDLVRQARAGDERAGEALEQIGRRLGSAIGSFVNVLDPEIVVVGGGFAEAGDLLLEPARQVVRREALEPARDLVRIVPSQLGGDAGLVGAAILALEAQD
jgi:glucokinase